MSDYVCVNCNTSLDEDNGLCDDCFASIPKDEWFSFVKETPYSTRNQDGQIKYFDSIEEALSDFIGDTGYRLSIEIPGNNVHIYRDELPEIEDHKPGSLGYEIQHKQITYVAAVRVNRQ